VFGHFARNIRSPSAVSQRKVTIESALSFNLPERS
jgi:hypothetical protein